MDNNITPDVEIHLNSIKLEEQFVIFFIHPKTAQIIFLAYPADIESICYSDNPKLPGTLNYKLAKLYDTLNAAKNDIYKLRYHHRMFLYVQCGVKSVLHIITETKKLLPSDIIDYSLLELTEK